MRSICEKENSAEVRVCLFVCLFVFPVNKIQISYTESCKITMIKILGKELAADLKVLSPSP